MNNPDFSAGGRSTLSETRDAVTDYRRLLNALEARARRMGSRDPESAAQEALKRSLENTMSQPAVEYYFSEDLPPDAVPPAWPLDQLMAWLHGVLHFVVLEEHNRASNRRELAGWARHGDTESRLDPPDPAPGQLDALIQKELEQIVIDCLPALDADYRRVLKMRASGLKYGDIAARLGVSENTVATWVSRGIRTLAQSVRRRMQYHRTAR
ncbi:MAG: RNA polymerase sigma factor [Bryobacteraceae bacterium]|jgi:RNA polymerase sigma factor (sigma-70 family)